MKPGRRVDTKASERTAEGRLSMWSRRKKKESGEAGDVEGRGEGEKVTGEEQADEKPPGFEWVKSEQEVQEEEE